MKASAITRIILYSLVALLLIGLLLTGLGIGALMFRINIGGEYTTGEGSVPAADITELSLDWASGTITIQTADTDEITFTESGNFAEDQAMAYSTKGGTLSISYSQPSLQIGFVSIPSKDLTVTVPEDWFCETLELDGASLTVDITGLQVGTLDIDGASNEVTFNGSVDTVDCDGASCDVEIVAANRIDEIDLDGASCSLSLSLPEGCGFEVRMDGLSCDFRSDLTYTSSDGDYFYGDNHCKINADGVSCDITIGSSGVCAHVWDGGTLMVAPGSIRQEMVYTCTLCGSTKSELVGTTGPYQLTFANDFTRDMILDTLQGSHAPGSVVTFRTDILTDVDLELYVNGQFICKQTEVFDAEGNNFWEFYFTMPAGNAVIQLKTSGGM